MINRDAILAKTDGHCAYCGKKLNRFGGWSNWHIEHMIPKSRGGSDNPDNLVAACKECNLTKATRTPFEFEVHRVVHSDDNLDGLLNNAVGQLKLAQRYRSPELQQEIDEIINRILDIPVEVYLGDWPIFYYTDFPDESERIKKYWSQYE